MNHITDDTLAQDDMLRLTAQNAPVILFMIDNQGVVQLTFGKSLSELTRGQSSIGQSIYEIYQNQPEIIAYFERARAGESFSVMVEVPDLGMAFETRFEPLRSPQGLIQGVVGVAVDQTQQLKAERALRQQIRMTQMLNEITGIANTAQNLESAITYSLERICQVFNWPLGHAYLASEEFPGTLVPSNLWCSLDHSRFQDFMLTTSQLRQEKGQGLAGYVFATKHAYFMDNLAQHPLFKRRQAAVQAGLKTALAFPVLVGDEVAAVLEFFSDEDIQLDETLLELGQHIGTQIGRVAERERAHRALHASEERFRLLIESVEEYAIVILDPEGRVSSWNSGAQAIKGYTEDEILGKHLSTFYPAEARASGEPEEALRAARQDGRYEYEGWLQRKDGSTFWANVVMTPMYSENGELVGFARVTRDMSRRKRIEEALRASENRFRTIFEGSAVGIELVDLEGRLLAYNPSVLRIFGYSASELDQVVLSEQDHPANVVANSSLFDEMRAGERDTYILERPYRHKDGSLIWGRTTVSLVRDVNKTPSFVIAMVEDITERKQMESEVVELQRRLMEGREAERLHLAQDLHDGPVQELYGLTYQLQNLEGQLEGEQAEKLAEAREVVSKVIGTLRSMSGDLRPPTLAPFGLEKAIYSHARTFQDAYPELKLNLDLMPDRQELPENIRLALYRIYQASLTNVLRHARADQVDVRFSFDDQQAILEIQDNGQGFVVPVRWINLAREGHLGLVSAHERALAIGGQFEVKSLPGHGTLVRVIVPRTNGQVNSPFTA